MRTLLLVSALLLGLIGGASAQNSWTTPGGSGANGEVSMCLNSAGQAIPIGPLCANPVPVTTAAPSNVTPTDCSGTIAAGGTAQNAIAAQTALHGFTIANIDPSAGSGEPLWISFTGTAAAGAVASYPLSAPTATTFAGLSSFSTPFGFGTNHAVSIVGATLGHKFSCTWW